MPTLPPWPPRRYPGHHVIAFTLNRLGSLQQLAHEYGDIAAVRIGPRYLVLLNHPDYINDVLVTHSRKFIKGYGLQRARRLLGNGLLTSEGDFHRRQRCSLRFIASALPPMARSWSLTRRMLVNAACGFANSQHGNCSCLGSAENRMLSGGVRVRFHAVPMADKLKITHLDGSKLYHRGPFR